MAEDAYLKKLVKEEISMKEDNKVSQKVLIPPLNFALVNPGVYRSGCSSIAPTATITSTQIKFNLFTYI